MNQNIPFIIFQVVPFILLVTVFHLAGTTIYQRYTGLGRAQATLLFWTVVIIGGILTLHLPGSPLNIYHSDLSKQQWTIQAVSFFGLWILGAPFVVRLYRKWIGGHVTEAEKLPGMEGVRAWLGVGNVICAIAIPFCVAYAFGPVEQLPMVCQPVSLLCLTFGLLLAYPLLKTAPDPVQSAPAIPADDTVKEREKVLQLLEAGKINASESAELLNALSHRPPAAPKLVEEINPQRKIILLGAALLLVGFFLPWFTVNRGEEVNRMFTQIMQNFLNSESMRHPGVIFSQNDIVLHIGAGDLDHGLGWWILMLGIGAAVLPFFATNLSGQMQKKVMLACLGAGAIILLYLFTNNLHFVSVGILFVLAGYVLEVVGTLQERPAAR